MSKIENNKFIFELLPIINNSSIMWVLYDLFVGNLILSKLYCKNIKIIILIIRILLIRILFLKMMKKFS